MQWKPVVKTLVLVSADLGVSYAVNTGLSKAATRVMPTLKEWNEEWTPQEKAIQAAKLVGVTLGIAVVAAGTVMVVHNAIDENLWTDEYPTEELPES